MWFSPIRLTTSVACRFDSLLSADAKFFYQKPEIRLSDKGPRQCQCLSYPQLAGARVTKLSADLSDPEAHATSPRTGPALLEVHAADAYYD